MLSIDYTGTYTAAQLRELRDRRIGWNTGTPEDHAEERRARSELLGEALAVLDEFNELRAVELARDGSIVAVLVTEDL